MSPIASLSDCDVDHFFEIWNDGAYDLYYSTASFMQLNEMISRPVIYVSMRTFSLLLIDGGSTDKLGSCLIRTQF